ncbi:MAG TPA: prenyltransferase/squalene oxidase repeat-containing protein, partial [Thermoanaerobaculia bacterium]|nr:prenyltransferase/squalene oxidase repeat-containing protein [Thermoanaerobaculia bacterium]
MRSAFSVPASTGGAALEGFRERAASRLLEERPDGVRWRGELSSSALSTATAACALELRRRALGADAGGGSRRLVESALDWLATHQNEDGGWGDTTDSPSNPSTTVLAWVALGLKPRSSGERSRSVERAEAWIRRRIGSLEGRELGRAIVGAYGEDRTFSVPILTMAALGGRLGDGRDAWGVVEALPFELAALPHHWLHRVGLPMVSYALPALIAIGQVRHHRRPPRNPLVRWIRDATRRRTLAVLERIQPSSGGFLEAAPLTSFVGMSLVGAGRPRHPVVERAAGFLESTVRDDGSWPIDTDLSIWLTTLAVNALAAGGRLDAHLGEGERAALLDWLLARQHLDEHPYTAAAPGGWAWTDASGGVPDADDTAGALLALWSLASKTGSGEVPDAELRERAALGVGWLLDLQNRDGGIPTFCRGWGRLPFDRSSPDLTAHALRAWHCWRRELGGELG